MNERDIELRAKRIYMKSRRNDPEVRRKESEYQKKWYHEKGGKKWMDDYLKRKKVLCYKCQTKAEYSVIIEAIDNPGATENRNVCKYCKNIIMEMLWNG